jgi:hypothetical protein
MTPRDWLLAAVALWPACLCVLAVILVVELRRNGPRSVSRPASVRGWLRMWAHKDPELPADRPGPPGAGTGSFPG